MISMIVAFIFSMAISYNAYANEKINLREFSAYIGDFSEQKYDVIKQKVMELQNKYEETQNADVMNEMFVYLTLDKDALNCHNVVEYRDSVISDSEIKIKTESGYYKGPEFTSSEYESHGEYKICFVSLQDVALGKINLVPASFKDEFIHNLNKVQDVFYLDSKNNNFQ